MARKRTRKKSKRLPFKPVKRQQAPAPIPHIISEKDLPRGHKALVFLPHSDDGAYIGATLHLMNKPQGKERKRPNDMKVVVVSPGHHGVHSDAPKEKKTQNRLEEAQCWGEMLGFGPEQMHYFGAEKTYEVRAAIDRSEQKRMERYIRDQQPTMVFVPSIHDTSQHINFNTRRMVLRAVNRWIEDGHNEGKKREVMVVEYPTNHVPILPPSDKNFDVAFTDPNLTLVKHEANRAH
jgi:LmbE family N-acetylglucosaminyl deacetylase